MGVSRRRFVQGVAMAGAMVPLRRMWGAADGPVVVSTPSGRLAGAMEDGVRVFRGVPFAAPPVGELRYRAPVAMKAWAGTRDASRFAAAAMQKPHDGEAMSEDCLYLNVWAPVSGGAAGKGPWPVFVWIHGGGYTGGESFTPIFDGAGFAAAGIVVVTIAYRLGVFGFLDVSPLLGAGYADSANNGTRDMVMALKWVQANIAAFGGDPGRVTVGGESAGAKSTAALMAIPEAAGLFQSAISESGGGERVFARAMAGTVAQGFATRFRSDHPGGSEVDLRTAGAADLMQVQENYLAATTIHFPFRVETGAMAGALLPLSPIDTMRAEGWKGKRLLIGTNRDESAAFVGPKPSGAVKPSDLGNVPLATFEGVYAKYAALYPEMTAGQREIRALTAEEYWVPSVRVANANVRAGGATWMYRLDWTAASGRMAGEAYHSEDLGFVWDKLTAAEQAQAGAAGLAASMHAAWVEFIRGGTPVGAGLPSWPAYAAGTRSTMMFDAVSRVEERPAEAELRLWDGLLE